jgi:hypothetical protein
MPGELIEVLQWHADVQSKVSASPGMAEFAGRFLGGMYEDGAVLPTNLATSVKVPGTSRRSILQDKPCGRNHEWNK